MKLALNLKKLGLDILILAVILILVIAGVSFNLSSANKKLNLVVSELCLVEQHLDFQMFVIEELDKDPYVTEKIDKMIYPNGPLPEPTRSQKDLEFLAHVCDK